MARRDENGYLFFMDRAKDMIKSGGENVSSQEVEEAIASHPTVAEVAVIGTPHPYWIEAVTAVVTARNGTQVTPDEVLAHCKSRLAGFKMPERVEIVDALSKNPNGKIMKQVLRKQFSEGE